MKKSLMILSLFLTSMMLLVSIIMPVNNLAIASSMFTIDNVNDKCKSCILVDTASGTIIYEKDANKKLPIASMTKLVSLGVIFNALDNGKINLDQEITVSQNAASAEGSEAFLDANKKYKIEDLIKTVIISSANDSTIALAETVAGSEENFVYKMNELAKELGMEDSLFSNSTGLPAASHYSTARDMTFIYEKVAEHPIYKKYSKVWIDELVHKSGRKTGLVNTNRLIKSYSSCTGGKTGHTNEAGYCLTAAAKKGDMNLIGVVIGGVDSKARFNSMIAMFDYGFNTFENRVIVKKDKDVCEIEIKGAKEKSVKLYPESDYVKFLKKGEDFEYSTAIDLFEAKAPINENQALGVIMILDKNNIVIEEINLITNKQIEKINLNEVLNKIYLNW